MTQPPGADYCNVYLLDSFQQSIFLNGNTKIEIQPIAEGTRQNVKSATVNIKCCKGDQYYLGIQNPDPFHGVHLAIEAVGVKSEEYLVWVE